jgi:hemolysin activation/secretion protein
MLAPEAFTPPPSPPPVVELRLPAHAGGPLLVRSHGYAYRVSGNTLLDAAKLQRLIAAAATPADAVGAMNQAYQHAGYALVALRAEVQGQDVDVRVIEGRITRVHARPDVARFYRGVAFDPALSNDALIRRNILAQGYAAREGLGLKPSVAPAPQHGGTELSVDTPPQPGWRPLSGNVVLGNYGSRYVGGDVLGENLQWHPGHGLEFNLGYAHGLPGLTSAAAGSRYDAVNAGASVFTPWGLYGLAYSRSHYRVGQIASAFTPVGETETWGLTGSQLVFASPTLRLSTTQGLNHVWNHATVFGTYVLTDQDYNDASVGVQANANASLFGQPAAFSVGLGYTLGLTAPRATLSAQTPGAPQSRFHDWTLNASWQQNLPRGWTSSLSGSAQWALDTLPQNQQWVLGGYGSLSAWTPGLLVGDGGYLLRGQLATPPRSWRGWQVAANGFIEQGAVTFHYMAAGLPAWSMLADAGVGLTLTSPWKTQLTLSAARPIASKNVTATTMASQRSLYLVVQQSF